MSASARVRLEAARALGRVQRGQSLDDALAAVEAQGLSEQNLSLIRAMTYGVLRERRWLETLLESMLQKPLEKEPELHSLLLCGLHQLHAMRMPAFAAVDETVEAVVLLGKPWAKGLANAILRRYQRESRPLEAALPADPATRYSYPSWLVAAIQKDWPQSWKDVLVAGNEQGPLTLRVNRRRTTRDDYVARLAAAGHVATPVEAAPDALVLADAAPVELLPGFAEGLASVQDAAAQLAVGLLDLAPGLRVLDACAAPGGKSAHMLEGFDLDVTAIDVDERRLDRVRETLARLGLQARVLQGDAIRPKGWWDEQPFDRILIDAPCSGTGVIRRHPDIKWLRRESDVATLAGLQGQLLRGVWPLLKPRGRLVYATCSVLRAEGSDVIGTFLGQFDDARECVIDAPWGEACAHGRRLAPGGPFDGFYFAALEKRP